MTVEEPLQRQLDQSHDSDKPTKIDTSFLREPSGNLSSAGTTPPLSSNSSQVTTNSTSSMHKLKDDSYVKKNIGKYLLFEYTPKLILKIFTCCSRACLLMIFISRIMSVPCRRISWYRERFIYLIITLDSSPTFSAILRMYFL